VEQKAEPVINTPNSTPSLSLDGIGELVENRQKKKPKLGKRKAGTSYWQPVKGIIRWELRQHYYDSDGKRRTRVLETRARKPRIKE